MNISLREHHVGDGQPVYIIAEVSANHYQDFEAAVRILHAAKEEKNTAKKPSSGAKFALNQVSGQYTMLLTVTNLRKI